MSDRLVEYVNKKRGLSLGEILSTANETQAAAGNRAGGLFFAPLIRVRPAVQGNKRPYQVIEPGATIHKAGNSRRGRL